MNKKDTFILYHASLRYLYFNVFGLQIGEMT